MEPGQNITVPEKVVNTNGPELMRAAETVPSSPKQTPTVSPQVTDDKVVSALSDSGPVSTVEVSTGEVKDLTDSTIEGADRDWVSKVKDVMKDDSGQPYKEEEDAEELNESYMKSRFNVDVDAPIEEK